MLAILAAGAAAAFGAIDGGARYPEGPLFHGADLLVAEMGADQVSRFDPSGRKRVFWKSDGCGPTAIAPYGQGFAALCHLAGAVAVLDGEGAEVRRLEGLGNPNDASADRATGAVFFSSPGAFSARAPARGRLMRLDADGTVSVVDSGLRYPNGVWVDARARQVFVSEHLARRILRYDITADGALTGKTIFAELDALLPPSEAPPYAEAGPDGLERAPNGDLVVALYGEGRLVQLTPEGKLRRTIAVPIRFVTNIAFAQDGSARVVGAHENDTPELRGAVITLPPSAFARR